MTSLIYWGLPNKDAFDIMEAVRKGKVASGAVAEKWDKWKAMMKECNVPDWYIGSCEKIKYMFPKAHAAAYSISTLRVAWFKVYYPEEYYCAYFTVRGEEFDAQYMCKDMDTLKARMEDLKVKMHSKDSSAKKAQDEAAKAVKAANDAVSAANNAITDAEAAKKTADDASINTGDASDKIAGAKTTATAAGKTASPSTTGAAPRAAISFFPRWCGGSPGGNPRSAALAACFQRSPLPSACTGPRDTGWRSVRPCGSAP